MEQTLNAHAGIILIGHINFFLRIAFLNSAIQKAHNELAVLLQEHCYLSSLINEESQWTT